MQQDSEAFIPKNKCEDYISLFPENIKTIGLVTPAYVPDYACIRAVIAELEKSGVRVKVAPHAMDQAESGTSKIKLENRVSDFMGAWCDPEIDMLLCSRGGGGSMELIEHLDWERLRMRPDMPVLGFSDITIILCAMLRKKAGHPIAGPSCRTFDGLTAESLKHLSDVLHRRVTAPFELTPVKSGDVSGMAMAGHLERLNAIGATSYRPDTAGRIIFIECVRHGIAELNLYLDTLLATGFFAKASGVVFCHFTKCGDNPQEIAEMIDGFASRVDFPVYKGFPFGHEPSNFAVSYRSIAKIHENMLTFTPVEP